MRSALRKFASIYCIQYFCMFWSEKLKSSFGVLRKSQQIRTCIVLAENPNSIPNNVNWLITVGL